MLFCPVYCHQNAKYYKFITIQQLDSREICERIQLRQKGIIDKKMLKVKSAWKARPKNDVKGFTPTQSIDNFLSSQIKSDDMPFK